jgi:hypothetical protein
MALVKRLVKGSPLTFAEGDANLDYLENLAGNSTTFNNWTGSNTSQFSGTSSYALTASYALNAGGAGFPFNGNAIITGSLVVAGSSSGRSGITGSLQGTASFAITSSYALNGGVTSIVAGTGISRSGATGSVTITNTAPDQTVSLTDGTGISVTGTYPSFTITNSAPRIGPSYQQLLLIFSQTGINDPTFNGGTLENTTGATFTFKRIDAGYYEIETNIAVFSTDRTAVYLTPGYTPGIFDGGNEYTTFYEITSTSIIRIFSIKLGLGSTGYDGVFSQATLDINIY